MSEPMPASGLKPGATLFQEKVPVDETGNVRVKPSLAGQTVTLFREKIPVLVNDLVTLDNNTAVSRDTIQVSVMETGQVRMFYGAHFKLCDVPAQGRVLPPGYSVDKPLIHLLSRDDFLERAPALVWCSARLEIKVSSGAVLWTDALPAYHPTDKIRNMKVAVVWLESFYGRPIAEHTRTAMANALEQVMATKGLPIMGFPQPEPNNGDRVRFYPHPWFAKEVEREEIFMFDRRVSVEFFMVYGAFPDEATIDMILARMRETTRTKAEEKDLSPKKEAVPAKRGVRKIPLEFSR